MSTGPIDRSEDLLRLRDEGYEVEVANGYLLLSHIPYVSAAGLVELGTLASRLELASDRTSRPRDHVVLWAGKFPCSSKGLRLEPLVNNANIHEEIRPGLVATHSFSQKPEGGYVDYHHKMTAYVRILEGEACAVDPHVTSRTFPVTRAGDSAGPFNYVDTASSRAGIAALNARLAGGPVALVGLGGTGSYVLDLVAKTPVAEIHLFDSDTLLQHNAFRSPGAPSVEDLERKPKKVDWFASVYSKMRGRVIPHPYDVNESNLSDLDRMDFVFLCIESGAPKKAIVEHLIQRATPFVDVGMGLNVQDGSLGGLLRVTAFTPGFSDHVPKRISFDADGVPNEYNQNIQVADMNALNAVLAVIKWKKMRGFYVDMQREHHTVYGISTNLLTNEECSNDPAHHPA
jgi:ThiF family